MSIRKYRIDYSPALLVVVDKPEEPTPTRAPATKTPEGYLVADAYLARDGLLRYSDGATSWNELRPVDELVAAAASWAHQPVTDDHPPVMLDATNATEYSRGLVIESPRVVEVDGVNYLRARIKVTDADLVAKIFGGQTQLSIGFLADVAPERGRYKGDAYEAVQRGLAGNHVASVVKGRAGPSVRILLDGACIAVHHESVSAQRAPESRVSKPKTKTPENPKADTADKSDEAGAPATETEITGPEGSVLSVPTWLAAAYEHAVSNGWGGLGAPKPEAPAEEPAADAPPPAGPAPALDPDKDKDKPMTPDAVTALVSKARAEAVAEGRKRARLERLADKAGIEKFDAMDDLTLARTYVAAQTPHCKAIADKAEGAVLDALVEAAAATPAPVVNPFEKAREVKSDKDDPFLAEYTEHLVRSGCR